MPSSRSRNHLVSCTSRTRYLGLEDIHNYLVRGTWGSQTFTITADGLKLESDLTLLDALAVTGFNINLGRARQPVTWFPCARDFTMQ